jgi:hypothetical protein
LAVNYLETGLDPEGIGDVEEKAGLVTVLWIQDTDKCTNPVDLMLPRRAYN